MVNLKKIATTFFCVFVSNSFLMGMVERETLSPKRNFGLISSISISPTSTYYALVFNNGNLQVFKLHSKQLDGPILQLKNVNGKVAFSPDASTGTHLAYGMQDGSVKIIKVEDKERIRKLKVFDGPVEMVTFACTGDRIAVASSNKVCIAGLNSVEVQLEILPLSTFAISSLQWSPCGNYIAYGARNGDVIIRNVQLGCEVCKINGNGQCSACVAWSFDSRYLAIGSNNKIVMCEKREDGRFERFVTLQENLKEISAISWHPSGNLLVTVADGVARLWNAKNCECLRNLTGVIYSTNAAAFSPDGSNLVMNFSRIPSNRRICDILGIAKCTKCGTERDDLIEKDRDGKGSCLICQNCKSLIL